MSVSGAEHYREAERVREAMRTPHAQSMAGFDGWQRDDLTALATFHATMAVAAAIAPHLGDDPNAPF